MRRAWVVLVVVALALGALVPLAVLADTHDENGTAMYIPIVARAPAVVFAAADSKTGITLYVPDNTSECAPTFSITTSGVDPSWPVDYKIFEVADDGSTMTEIGSGSTSGDLNVEFTPNPLLAGESQTYAVFVKVAVPGREKPTKLSGQWTVSCPDGEPTPTDTPTKTVEPPTKTVEPPTKTVEPPTKTVEPPTPTPTDTPTNTPEPPTPTPTDTPTKTAEPPTPTPTDTPTNTPEPPTPTPTDTPTNTPEPPTPTPSDTPTNTPTATPTETPPPSGEGCTPGYWKNHEEVWEALANSTFSSVFGSDVFGTATMIEVAAQGGGGVNALGRHAVAAYANAASGDVNYDLTTQEVVDLFNAAVSGGDIEGTKDLFEGYNEQGCPL